MATRTVYHITGYHPHVLAIKNKYPGLHSVSALNLLTKRDEGGRVFTFGATDARLRKVLDTDFGLRVYLCLIYCTVALRSLNTHIAIIFMYLLYY